MRVLLLCCCYNSSVHCGNGFHSVRKEEIPTAVSSMMTLERFINICYPQYKELGRAVKTLPLKARSLLIKSCQAQTIFDRNDDSTLSNLIRQHPPVAYELHGRMVTSNLLDFFPNLDIAPLDPLTSSIILDILRCTDLPEFEIDMARLNGWSTEIRLAETPGRPSVNFIPFLFNSDALIHPDVPHNPRMLRKIRYRFERFKRHLINSPPTFYPRATHKNMSRSTRREFERTFNADISDFVIFGQDDWQRVYHETGVALGGVVEMRQKWYPSGAKPRTYFAMGGYCYQHCRFLQDFFTDLVNIFPATNHITRLRPSRLRISMMDENDPSHYRIYDLSSFTSNMAEQKSFVAALIEFFWDIEVVIVDEISGPVPVLLSELLQEYYDTCVDNPILSYERAAVEGLMITDDRNHARASLLGVFGNLMTCTLAHYLLVAPCLDEEDEDNTAGDDGLVLETLMNRYCLDAAISLVGDCADDKTMRSNELGAVCLKRPLTEDPPLLHLGYAITPPNLATTLSYLFGSPFDKRFEFHGLEDLRSEDRLSIVGKDLMRFLESCFVWGVSSEDASSVYRGFRRLVHKVTGKLPISAPLATSRYVWPIDPAEYLWSSISPLACYAQTFCCVLDFHVRLEEPINYRDLRFAGDEVIGNSDQRLVLLERLGYLDKTARVETLSGSDSVRRWLDMQKSQYYEPVLYTYVCLKDVPESLLF